jgi:hypothetical protein
LARKVNLRRSDKDKGSFFWAKNCGECHPGGGPAEYDRRGNRYDEFAADPKNRIEHMGDNYLDGDYYQAGWVNSGVTEADCLICHSGRIRLAGKIPCVARRFSGQIRNGWRRMVQEYGKNGPADAVDPAAGRIADHRLYPNRYC